jgi:catechol 2,3-dioxygenase-like lactoylglutathione lyase family enzyme
MATIGLHHYNLRADREMLDTLRDFYCETVGLRVGERPPFQSFGYWLYAGNDAILHLSEARLGELRMSHVVTTFDHVAFSCSDFDATRVHLTRLNIEHTVTDVPHTGQRQIFFQDPAGNGIELNFAGAPQT